MRNFILSVVLIVAAGAAAWTYAYRRCCDPDLRAAARAGDAEHWLRREFHLNDAQMAAIEKLQTDYAKECSVHCHRIMEAKEALMALESESNIPVARLTTARTEVTQREAECRDAIRGHLRKVAALMPPAEGRRYLAMLLPKVDAFRHEGAPNLRLDP